MRITVGQGPPWCEVAGISNRLPVVRAVGLRTASALVADGVPLVVRDLRAGDPATIPPSPDDAAVVATRAPAGG